MKGPVLVTGGSGFVGGALLARLAREGVETVALARTGGGAPRLAAEGSAEVVRVPGGDAVALRRALGGRRFAAVFHLASHGTAPGQTDAAQLAAGNAALVEQLLGALEAAPPERMLLASTWSVYGARQAPARIDESCPLDPRTPYAVAKAEAEDIGGARATALGVPLLVMRLFHVYGPGEGPHRLVPHLVRALRSEAPPALTAGEQQRDFVYVDDVADALVAAARAEAPAPGVYNVCTGHAASVRQVVELVADALGVTHGRLGLGALPYRAHEPMWAVGDPEKLAAATGWRARTPLAAGVARAVQHELERAA